MTTVLIVIHLMVAGRFRWLDARGRHHRRNDGTLARRDESAHLARLPGASTLATICTKHAGPEVRLFQ